MLTKTVQQLRPKKQLKSLELPLNTTSVGKLKVKNKYVVSMFLHCIKKINMLGY